MKTLFSIVSTLVTVASLFGASPSNTVIGWGSNDSGESNVPAGLTGVMAIAAGGGHSVALKNDATVVAWGENSYGQTTIPSNLSGVTAVSAGWQHSIALKNDGTLVAWGNNTFASG
jgi:alpha-tubulin suppressor-like RCC1 family protein